VPVTQRTIFNTIVNEAGQPLAGVPVKAYLVTHQFVKGQSVEVIRVSVSTVSDATGYWELSLVPNDTMEDPNSFYIIEEGMPTDKYYHRHYVRIPSGTGALSLEQARISPPFTLPSIPPEGLVSGVLVAGQQPLKGQVTFAAGEGIALSQDNTTKVITITQVARTVWQKIAVLLNGTLYGVRSKINFITGSNVSISVTDDAANDAVNVTINAVGGGGGGGGGAHNLLSDTHLDTQPTAVQRGMLIVGQLVSGVLKWAGLALGAAGKFLKSNGTDVVWGDVDWTEVQNKPSTFPPSPHTHDAADIASGRLSASRLPTSPNANRFLVVRTSNSDPTYDVIQASDLPSHTHSPSQITPQGHGSGLNADMVDGQHASDFAPASHTHTKSQITDLETITTTPTANAVPKADALGKIALGWIPQGSGSNLDADRLDGLDSTAFERVANKGVANGYAPLDANAKVPVVNIADNLRVATIGLTVGDGVNVITTGFKGAIPVPFSGTITEWTIVSTDANPPTTGSIEIDILKSTYANYPTMSSMVGTGTKPNIANSNKGTGTPTGWTTTTINAGDIIGFNVTSVSGLKRITIVLKVVKS
jgi:hypothetical protein